MIVWQLNCVNHACQFENNSIVDLTVQNAPLFLSILLPLELPYCLLVLTDLSVGVSEHGNEHVEQHQVRDYHVEEQHHLK